MQDDDLNLRHRKAFELCAAVNIVILDHGADPLEPHIETARDEARKIAVDEIRKPQDDVALTDFLKTSMIEIAQAARKRAIRYAPSPAGASALTALEQFAAPVDTAACRMRATFEHCATAARRFYDSHLSHIRTLPAITFRILEANRRNEAFPGKPTAFHGWVTFRDTADGEKSSLVTLRVLPTALECSCIEMLPYIIMHELVCHWPQMSACREARPNPQTIGDPTDVDAMLVEVDPFSEGWMDWLVAEVLGWRRYDGRSSSSSDEEVRMAETIHTIRTKATSTSRFPDAPRIEVGRKAAGYVSRLYRRDHSALLTAQRDFHRLSCALNLADWTYSQRRDGCQGIVEACQAYEAAGWILDRISEKSPRPLCAAYWISLPRGMPMRCWRR